MEEGLIKKESKFCGCTYCGKIGTKFKMCSNCKISKYCSKECQREDWPKHKITCNKGNSLHDIREMFCLWYKLYKESQPFRKIIKELENKKFIYLELDSVYNIWDKNIHLKTFDIEGLEKIMKEMAAFGAPKDSFQNRLELFYKNPDKIVPVFVSLHINEINTSYLLFLENR